MDELEPCFHRRGSRVEVSGSKLVQQAVDVARLTESDGPIGTVACDLHAEDEPRLPQVLHLEEAVEPLLVPAKHGKRVGKDEEVVHVESEDEDVLLDSEAIHAVVAGEWHEVDALECRVDGLMPGSTRLLESVKAFVQVAN